MLVLVLPVWGRLSLGCCFFASVMTGAQALHLLPDWGGVSRDHEERCRENQVAYRQYLDPRTKPLNQISSAVLCTERPNRLTLTWTLCPARPNPNPCKQADKVTSCFRYPPHPSALPPLPLLQALPIMIPRASRALTPNRPRKKTSMLRGFFPNKRRATVLQRQHEAMGRESVKPKVKMGRVRQTPRASHPPQARSETRRTRSCERCSSGTSPPASTRRR